MGKKINGRLKNFMKCVLNSDGAIQEASSEFCAMLDYTMQAMEGKTFKDLVHVNEYTGWSNLLDEIKYDQSGGCESELTLVTKLGDSISVYLSGILVRDKNGTPKSIACYIQNLSKQKQVLQKLDEREQQFNSLFSNNPHPVYYFDLDGNFAGVNDKLLEFTGYNRKELLEKGFKEFVVQEDIDRTKKHFQKAIEGKSGQYEIRVVVKDGEKRDIRVTKFPRYSGNQVVGVFGILQDITEQKKSKRKLERSEERWQQLVEQNPQPVQIVQDGKIVFINRSGANYYGADSIDELIGKPIIEFTHPDYKDIILMRKELLENNKFVEPAEHKIILANGDEKYIETHSIPITYKDEPAIQTVIHDITNLKEKQDFIGKSLKEKETLLKEIHHRVKNNLAMISSMLELQIMQSTDKSAISALRDSQLRIRSMGMIHEKLYQNESLHDIGFDEYLEELVQTIRKTYAAKDKNIETSFDLDQVSIDINQVIPCSLIVNEVIVNSFKHAFTDKKEGLLHISMGFENNTIDLTIEDDGIGLPENFNIKEQDSLGMTLIQTLSNQLNGTFNLYNASNGGGTLFKLQFDKTSH